MSRCPAVRNYAIVIGITSVLCLQLTVNAGEVSRLLAREALVGLQKQGYAIVFSTDVVPPDLYIDLDLSDLTVQSVRRALGEAGLDLVPLGELLLVTKPVPPAPASTLRLISGAGIEIETAELVIDGRTVPIRRNRDGLFECSIDIGSEVTISAPGHQPTAATIWMSNQEILLYEIPKIATVIVTGSRYRLPHRSSTGSSTTYSAEEMSLVPALGGDSMRVATRLPGVSSVGVSARPRIRGGLQDELLVLVDGVELLDPFHLADFQSIFSSIDDRTVDAIDVYTGGFPARYGNRMSGVMEVTTTGQRAKPGTELGVSMFSALINTRGRTESGDTTWLASARRGNLDLLTNRVNSRSGDPKYFDAYARVGHRLNDSAELFVGGFFSRDDVILKDDEETAESDIDSRYTWLRLDVDHSAGIASTSVLTYVWSNRDKQQFSPDEDEDSAGFLDYTQRTRKYSGRSDWSYSLDEHLMEFGAQVEYAKSEYDAVALIDRGALSDAIGRPRVEAFDIHEHPDGWSGGIYWSGEFVVFDVLTVQPGLRWDFQNYYHRAGFTDQISPRLGLKYALRDNLDLRLDAGRFYQPEGIHEMQASDGIDHFFAPQRADHFIAALEWSPMPAWDVRVEGYHKRYQRTKTRFENMFNPFVLLPELEPDRVAISPSRARATGYDVETSRLFSDVLSASLRYSYMDADDRINGTWISRRWSQRHTVNAMASWRFETFSVSAALTWHSGWRTSEPPDTLAAGEELPLERLLNNKELKDYVSFDLSASKWWQVGRSRITTYADITNVFNRDNAAGIDYDVEELDDGSFVFTPDRETLLPVIVSVGILVSF